jgi:hypothetical protein
VEGLAEALLEHETLSHDALVEVMGEREFGSEAYRTYVKNARKPIASEEQAEEAEVVKEKEKSEPESESEQATPTPTPV